MQNIQVKSDDVSRSPPPPSSSFNQSSLKPTSASAPQGESVVAASYQQRLSQCYGSEQNPIFQASWEDDQIQQESLIREQLENIIVEDNATESACAPRTENVALSGDEFGTSTNDDGTQKRPVSFQCLSHDEPSSLYSQKPTPRRVSEQAADLTASQRSNLLEQEQAYSEEDNPYDGQNRSKTNSAGPIRAGNGQNFSDGALGGYSQKQPRQFGGQPGGRMNKSFENDDDDQDKPWSLNQTSPQQAVYPHSGSAQQHSQLWVPEFSPTGHQITSSQANQNQHAYHQNQVQMQQFAERQQAYPGGLQQQLLGHPPFQGGLSPQQDKQKMEYLREQAYLQQQAFQQQQQQLSGSPTATYWVSQEGKIEQVVSAQPHMQQNLHHLPVFSHNNTPNLTNTGSHGFMSQQHEPAGGNAPQQHQSIFSGQNDLTTSQQHFSVFETPKQSHNQRLQHTSQMQMAQTTSGFSPQHQNHYLFQGNMVTPSTAITGNITPEVGHLRHQNNSATPAGMTAKHHYLMGGSIQQQLQSLFTTQQQQALEQQHDSQQSNMSPPNGGGSSIGEQHRMQMFQTISSAETPSPARMHPSIQEQNLLSNGGYYQGYYNVSPNSPQRQQQFVQQHPHHQQQQSAVQMMSIPQFQHGSAASQQGVPPPYQQQQMLSPFDPSKHMSAGGGEQQSMTNSTSSLQTQQVMNMFEGLEITNSNFRPHAGGSAVKPISRLQQFEQQNDHHTAAGSALRGPTQNHLIQPPRSNHRNQQTKQAKSEANSHKSGFSGMIAATSNGGSTTATYNDSANDDQQASILITKLQKLPANATWSDKQSLLSGKIARLSQTQTGSRYLQDQLLSKSNPSLIEFLLHEIGSSLPDIMVNQYGNYFFQKLLSNCSVEQRLQILDHIKDDFIKICCHKQGTHTIQTIFDNVSMDKEESFIRQALQGYVFQLSVDLQGTHVIRKVLQCGSFDQEHQNFLFEEIYANLTKLCLNKNGLCVIKIIISLTKTARQKQKVINQILPNLITLVSNPFGNYAVSQIVEKWEPKFCRPIFDKLSSKIFELSIQKYSSCVIEKCLENGGRQTCSTFILEISKLPRLSTLIAHSYGNFVIQKALKLAHGGEKQELVAAIKRSFPQIQDKKIRAKWQEIIESSNYDFSMMEQSPYYEDPYSEQIEPDYYKQKRPFQQSSPSKSSSNYKDSGSSSQRIFDAPVKGSNQGFNGNGSFVPNKNQKRYKEKGGSNRGPHSSQNFQPNDSSASYVSRTSGGPGNNGERQFYQQEGSTSNGNNSGGKGRKMRQQQQESK